MTLSQIFDKPIIRSISTIAEEKIYSFKRRTVFSPGITDNLTIKFCSVTGECGAKSQRHMHPGDEVVITLQGENINYADNREIPLRRNEAIAIPPGRAHSTLVTGSGTWKGLSFYCDDCPHVKKNSRGAQTAVIIKSLKPAHFSPAPGLHKYTLFSPAPQETHFMEISVFSCIARVPVSRFTHLGETVYCAATGSFLLSWKNNRVHIEPGMAAAIPAGLPHGFEVDNPTGCIIIVGSCSVCPLTGHKPEDLGTQNTV